MKEILNIYTYIDGINDVPFYDVENPIQITEYTYNSARMGSRTLSASFMFPTCLDKLWTGKEYVIFNKQRFYLKGIPSSSKNNTDARYRHEMQFLDEMTLKLTNVYMYDAVSQDPATDDKYKSNTSRFVFFGDINEFAHRLQSSLKYSGLEYVIVQDSGIKSEEKLVSFEDKTFFEALQLAYETYKIPYYFVGDEIHFGYTSNVIDEVFKYGCENSLLGIKKNNLNYKIVTRCTGLGSEKNIPYYYPNKTAKGDVEVVTKGISRYSIEFTNYNKFIDKIALGKPITYETFVSSQWLGFYSEGKMLLPLNGGERIPSASGDWQVDTIDYLVKFTCLKKGIVKIRPEIYIDYINDGNSNYRNREYDLTGGLWVLYDANGNRVSSASGLEDNKESQTSVVATNLISDRNNVLESLFISIPEAGDYQLRVSYSTKVKGKPQQGKTFYYHTQFAVTVGVGVNTVSKSAWVYEGKVVELKDFGIKVNTTPTNGSQISLTKKSWMIPSQNLLPPIYRHTLGAERYYNAFNNTYIIPNTSTRQYYVFSNEYTPIAPHEQIMRFDDIYPTVERMTNAQGVEMAQFLDVAFDQNDNDEIDEEGNYKHQYFFVKLPRFNGKWGFNLFDHAIENGGMTFGMKTGKCGGCQFTVGVDDNSQKNLVQVDNYGNLKRDNDGNVLWDGQQPQDRQNDTSIYEVWVALKKEDSTFGVIMPNATNHYRPSAGDKFVITNINLPQAYIDKAENDLKEAIIKAMAEQNADKFQFSIDFSRIYLAENPLVYSQLNENARINVEYDNVVKTFYIKQYSYKAVDEESLPEISVELGENIEGYHGQLQQVIDDIKTEYTSQINSLDILGITSRYFLRKDTQDVAQQMIRFLQGATFGGEKQGYGGSISIDANGNSTAVFDFLKIRKKAIFNEITVQELNHVGGKMILSPAAMVCSRVDILSDRFRCYFNQKDEEGNAIQNDFVVNDLALSQSFSNLKSTYYWRRVIGVGVDYIDLSLSDADTNSDVPVAGNVIVQLGNKTNTQRQSAHIMSSFGVGSPSYVVYQGINSYSLKDKEVYGFVYNEEKNEPEFFSYGSMFIGDKNLQDPTATFITFQQKQGDTKKKLFIQADINIGAGSTGLENLSEWADKQQQIDNAGTNASDAKKLAEENQKFANSLSGELDIVKKQVDKSITTWFYDPVPTLGNPPANEWKTNDDKNVHLGDLYYSGEGKAYRFQHTERDGYFWQVITDVDLTKALADAKKAQDTADKKRRVFVDTPFVPYDIGDLWVNATYSKGSVSYSGDLLRCKLKKGQQASFSIDDWELATKYTDDTTANQAIEDAKNAQTVADNAKQRLDQWALDGYISPSEKQGIKNEKASVEADNSHIQDSYVKYAGYIKGNLVDFNAKYKAYHDQLVAILNSKEENVKIPDGFDLNQKNFYDARTTALNAIAEASQAYTKDKIDDIETGSVNILDNSKKFWMSETTTNQNVELANNECLVVKQGRYDCFGTLPVDKTLIFSERTYTLGIDVKISGNYYHQNKIIFGYKKGNSVVKNSSMLPENVNKWVRHYITLTLNAENDINALDFFLKFEGENPINPSHFQSGLTIEYRDINLVSGNKGSAWTPSDNDLKQYTDIQSAIVEREHINSDKAYVDKNVALYELAVRQEYMDYDDAFGDYNRILGQIIDKTTTSANNLFATYRNAYYVAKNAIMDLIASSSDAGYLKKTFGYVVDVNGVVLAKLVGVKDENGIVVAGLNGSKEIGYDATHKKLLFFGGGSVQDAQNAKTRIYEDGHIESKSIDISENATIGEGAKVGGFKIRQGSIVNDTETKEGKNAYLSFSNTDNQIFAQFGNASFPTLGYPMAGTFESAKKDISGSGKNVALYASARGARESTALRLAGGCVSGMAYHNLVTQYSATIAHEVGNVICTNLSSTVTLTLPSMNIEDDGHVIRFARWGGGKVNIRTSPCKVISPYLTEVTVSKPKIYLSDSGGYVAYSGSVSDIGFSGDSWELVWCRDLDGGSWVQYKMPKNW